ncbi:MAG TPA: NeuD/PglB/VioB family sugar acetyltransferase [Allosphingosinicella sp.]|jgi:sugar O-acyltransferase (sialic acid O-acetyltransferase NeuD family)|nr:NeuD/PglB/VioB family sugar acetyltransferase [Allosphingosinicella sp.]
MKRLAFIGGGGFAKEVLEIAEMNGHRVVGYVGDSSGMLSRDYWGPKEALLDRRSDFDALCVAFGAVNRASIGARQKVIDWVVENGFESETLVSPHAVRASGVTLGRGTIVAHGAVISVDARIGDFAILNTGAIIGHDAVVGDNVTIAPVAFVGGATSIGSGSLVGPGASVLQSLSVGSHVIIGTGASVVRSVPDGATVVPLRSRSLKG